jgi:hypothetical protein
MRYAMSILSRFRTGWGKKQFEVLVKALEYGYATKTMGLKYDGNLGNDKTNVLEGLRTPLSRYLGLRDAGVRF